MIRDDDDDDDDDDVDIVELPKRCQPEEVWLFGAIDFRVASAKDKVKTWHAGEVFVYSWFVPARNLH